MLIDVDLPGSKKAESAGPLLSLIIPTLNEAENIPALVARISRTLSTAHEIIFADDASADGTADVAEGLRDEFPQVRVLRRTEHPGLSAAVLDGFRAARGRYLGVMDADLQHDQSILPQLVRALTTHDVAVASRYTPKGGTLGWSFVRELQSRVAGFLSRWALGIDIKDPLSGYFVLRRSAFEAVATDVKPRGWKILLEILAALPGARVAEVPFTFRARHAGESKLNHRVALTWLRQLRELRRERLQRSGDRRRSVAQLSDARSTTEVVA